MGRVLLVDDEPEILEVLRVVLTAGGHEAIVASGGEEALALLDEQAFDLLITDVRMKPVDGFELVERVRKAHPDMPFMMVTAFYANEARRKAEELGAVAYLKKPFDVDELLRLANSVLAGRP